MRTNKYGLSRDIPDPIKRQVRQACGFGCVVCGASIIEYEHVDPEFADATEHDASNITLLCPQCHSKVTRGMWSKRTIKSAMSNPRSKQEGFSNEFFDLGQSHPALAFGGMILRKCSIPIQVRDVPLFQVKAREEFGAPFRLSGHFFNSVGAPSLTIQDNEWKALSSNWDVEVSGKTIIVRDAPGHISLKLKADPPNGLLVEQLDMFVYGYRFIASLETFSFGPLGGGMMSFTNGISDASTIGFQLY